MQPGTPPQTTAPAPAEKPDRKVDYIMLAVYGVLTLLFCCGGAAITGVAGSESESDGMEAAMIAIGPGCCGCSGFLMALIGMFAFKKPGPKIASPIIVGIVGGIAGAIGMVVFFEVIWPEL